MKIIVSILVILSAFLGANGQDSLFFPANVTITADSNIDSLLKKRIELNSGKKTMQGYRIQLFYGQRQKALDIKAQFIRYYPDEVVHLVYEAPNFKVRVGDFRSKNEAYPLYYDLKRKFAGCFLVRDEINFPKLESY
jgi:hypothetical protein